MLEKNHLRYFADAQYDNEGRNKNKNIPHKSAWQTVSANDNPCKTQYIVVEKTTDHYFYFLQKKT